MGRTSPTWARLKLTVRSSRGFINVRARPEPDLPALEAREIVVQDFPRLNQVKAGIGLE